MNTEGLTLVQTVFTILGFYVAVRDKESVWIALCIVGLLYCAYQIYVAKKKRLRLSKEEDESTSKKRIGQIIFIASMCLTTAIAGYLVWNMIGLAHTDQSHDDNHSVSQTQTATEQNTIIPTPEDILAPPDEIQYEDLKKITINGPDGYPNTYGFAKELDGKACNQFTVSFSLDSLYGTDLPLINEADTKEERQKRIDQRAELITDSSVRLSCYENDQWNHIFNPGFRFSDEWVTVSSSWYSDPISPSMVMIYFTDKNLHLQKYGVSISESAE